MLNIQLPKMIKKLCQPSYTYFILVCVTVLMYIYMIIEKSSSLNIESINNYTKGGLIIYTITSFVWIIILNQLCKTSIGKKFAWFFVLFPFIVVALIIIGISCSISHMLLSQEKINEIHDEIKIRNSHNPDQP